MSYFPKCNFDPEEFKQAIDRICNSPAQKLSGSLTNEYEYRTSLSAGDVLTSTSFLTKQLAIPQALMMPEAIKEVIFHDPATIVYWLDGTKTVVKAQDEAFDPEKGLAMAICKKIFGNEGNYYNIFKKWLPKEEKVEITKYSEVEHKCRHCRFASKIGAFEPCRSCIRKTDKPGFQPKVKE